MPHIPQGLLEQAHLEARLFLHTRVHQLAQHHGAPPGWQPPQVQLPNQPQQLPHVHIQENGIDIEVHQEILHPNPSGLETPPHD